MNTERKWCGRWINAGMVMVSATDAPVPAFYFRKTFDCPEEIKEAVIYLCGLGLHELYVNGQKADDRVLAPVATQYDRHAGYICYDVSKLLVKGKNAVVVLLGNGLFNCSVYKWNFSRASWRDYPKLLCDIAVNGKTAAQSGPDWKIHASPVTFNEIRNGQYYDARLEIPGFSDPELDDSQWKAAALCTPPGGRVVLENMPPCKVMQTYSAVSERFVTFLETAYDFGTNLTGWCRVKVQGEAGAQVDISYAELADPNSGCINIQAIAPYENFGKFQTDRYILKGDPDGEIYEPAFAYHGFRYAQVRILGKAKLLDIQACFVHTAFAENGEFESSDPLLNTLQRNTLQSYKSNYTGIPTDCPHREKNGWTGDAAVVAETGLWNFDMSRSYAYFLQTLVDTQRPDGQLPGIAPSPGWGYNWGSGPAWDNLLFEYPWQIYLFDGTADLIARHYERFQLYLEYCESRSENHLLNFGLGDWCHWDGAAMTPVEVTSSGYYYQNVLRMALFSDLLGKTQAAGNWRSLAEKIRTAFLQKFAHADGSFADGSPTAVAAAVYFGLAEEDRKEKSAAFLADLVRSRQHKADFGILGAKFIPRVLAEYGYADDAFEIITQKEFPGWGWQVAQGATTLWENWNGKDSQNHIMFGDISAWMYQYLGGIRPLEETPGFRKFLIQPCFVEKLDHVKASHRSPFGMIRSEWRRSGGKISCRFEIPSGSQADIILPGRLIKDASGCIQTEF